MSDTLDNTPIMGPAGTVHMTLGDLCAFATEHLRGELGEGELLSTETYQRLHTSKLSWYGCGWITGNSDETTTPFYWHNGSNTVWYAFVVFIPERSMVIAVTSNDGDHVSAQAAAFEIVKARTAQNDAGIEIAPLGGYEKKSPFNALRWEESQPEVRINKEWFKLVSLNEIPADEIIAFSKQAYGELWRKRFEEDLVELLSEMRHPPKDEVTLVVQPISSLKTVTLENVPMTKANRKALRDAAQARANSTLTD